jgi:putative glutamine amidotransferase
MNPMKPRIAVPIPNSSRPQYVAAALPQYEYAVRSAGGEPIVIPIDATPSHIAQAVKACDAVLLPGSPADVDPEKYGAARHPATAPSDPFRDNTDELLLQDAFNMRKPVFGICYGLQSLNVWRTGTLNQQLPATVNHNAGRAVQQAHTVEIDAGSNLARILAEARVLSRSSASVIAVNSSHHQAPEAIGDGLRLAAWCPEDGVKEAVEGTSADQFILGVQWHPERTYDSEPASRAMFHAFVRAAARWHERLGSSRQDFESVIRKS